MMKYDFIPSQGSLYLDINNQIMKRLALLLSLIVVVGFYGVAQDSKVTSAVIAFDNGRTDEAITKLEEALAVKDQLKPKNLPKMYYYLAQAYMRAGDDTTISGNYTKPYLTSLEHAGQIEAVDEKKKFSKNLALYYSQIWSKLYNAGATAYNEQEYNDALDYFDAAVEVDGEDIGVQMMYGYSRYMTKDTSGTITSLTKALDLFEAQEAEKSGDASEEDAIDVSPAYLMISTLLEMQKKTDEALKVVQKGRSFYPNDGDLQKVELNIYQENPQLFEQAESKFVSAMEDDPDDLTVKLSFANLLMENNQAERSLALYNDVLTRDADNLVANLNIGAYYVNQAAVVNEKKMKMTDENEIDKAGEEVSVLLGKAYPYIKKMHDLQPKELEWINQLVSICYYIDKEDEAEKYLALQQKLNGSGN